MRRLLVSIAVVVVTVTASAPAEGRPGRGPREVIDMTFSTTKPGAPAGFTYSAAFRHPTNPNATPPSVRRIVLRSPAGARIDTSVPAICGATGAQLKADGDAACPRRSRIGSGSASIKILGLFPMSYPTSIFNRHNEQVELLKQGDGGVATVRGFFRGDDFDTPIPTCLNGGNPPQRCPFDEVALLENSLTIPPFTVGRGSALRSYFTTPAECPRSGAWSSRVTLYYGDGAVDRVTTEQPCSPAARAVRPGTRLRVRPRRVRAGSRRRFRFKALVAREGRWVPLRRARIRFAGRTRRTNRRGRASVVVRFRRPGRRRARLSKRGVRGATATVRVLRRR